MADASHAIVGSACGADIDGGSAVVGMTVFLPCTSGIVAVRATSSPPGLQLLWSSGTGGGPPIVAAGLVWTIGPNGVLYGLDPATGQVRQQAAIGMPANHFPTPSVADGLLLAACAQNVVAFAAPGPGSAAAVAASAAPHSLCQADKAPGPPVSSRVIDGIVLAALVVLAGLGWPAWLLFRRKSRRPPAGQLVAAIVGPRPGSGLRPLRARPSWPARPQPARAPAAGPRGRR